MTKENTDKKRGRVIVTVFLSSMVLISLAITMWATHDPKMVALAHGELIPLIKCTEVIDGRTLLIAFPDTTQTVYMAGLVLPLDANNSRLNEQAAEYGCIRKSITGQAGVAAKVLTGWVLRHRVSIIQPYEDREWRDENGDLIAYVEAFGLDVGRKLLQGGHVFASDEDHPYAAQYAQFQREAKEKQRGVWRP